MQIKIKTENNYQFQMIITIYLKLPHRIIKLKSKQKTHQFQMKRSKYNDLIRIFKLNSQNR